MAIRFRKSVKLAPGVRLNLGKKSASVRVGGKGLGYTTGTKGKTVSASVPGTGLGYSKKLPKSKSNGGSVGLLSVLLAVGVLLAIVFVVVGR